MDLVGLAAGSCTHEGRVNWIRLNSSSNHVLEVLTGKSSDSLYHGLDLLP